MEKSEKIKYEGIKTIKLIVLMILNVVRFYLRDILIFLFV